MGIHLFGGLRAPCCISLGVLLTGVFASAQAQWRPYTSLESLSYSEPLPVHAVLNELDGHLRSGERAFTHNQFEAGLFRGPWTLSLYSRYDYHLDFTSATAELLHHGENDLPLDAYRHYPLDLDAQHIFAHGIKVGYTGVPLDGLTLGVNLAYLSGQTVLDGGASGDVFTNDLASFSGEAFVDYSYSEDVLLHRSVDEPSGHGFSVDVRARWQASERLVLHVSAHDFLSAIYWRDAPYTTARLTSATVDFDADGFINTTPLLSGVEGKDDFKQTLPMRIHSGAVYQVNPYLSWSIKHMNLNSLDLVQVGMTLNTSDTTRWGMHYDTTAQAVVLNVERNGFSLRAGMDSLDFERAHFLSLAASVNIRF